MSAQRIGHRDRPDREWEVWNDSYSRDEVEYHAYPYDKPWTIFHPVIDPGTPEFATHAEAIAYLTAGDWDA